MKTWSSTQASIALSSGEAEYYALVKASAEALGIQSLAKDSDWCFQIRIWVDATSAKSIASRTGLGKVRHMETKYLWVQEALKKKKFSIRKIPGDNNPADVLTKPLSIGEMDSLLARVGAKLVRRVGRSETFARPRWADLSEENEASEHSAAVACAK